MEARAIGLLVLCANVSAGTPTFSKDVAPILFAHCAGCHRAGRIGPMPLLNYRQVRPWAKAIRSEVALGKMPPWFATQPRGVFLNDPRLSPHERDVLLAWAAGGAPEGDPADLPPAPKFTEGWELVDPDVVFSMPAPFHVPAWQAVDLQTFEIPTHFAQDKWVQAIEVRPSAPAVVHHVTIKCREPGMNSGAGAGYVQVLPPTFFTLDRTEVPIAIVAAGSNAIIFPEGLAMRIKAGAVLKLEIHYNPNGQPVDDVTRVAMKFAAKPPLNEMRAGAMVNPGLRIAPGDPDKEVDSVIEFTEDAHIWGIGGHMHYRGKSWEYRLIYPDGRSKVLLSIPHWDPNWQVYYRFAEPVAAPKGSRLAAAAHYDNSVNNPWNPDPRAEVHWGNQAWDEMQFSGFAYTLDEPHHSSAATAR